MMKAHWTRATTPTGVVVVAVWLVVGTAFSCAAVAYQQEQREPYQELLLVPVEENQQPQQNGYDAQKQWLGNKNANVQFVRVDKNAPDHKSADLDDTDKQQKNDERLVFPRPQTNCQTRIVVQRWGPPVSPPTTTTTPLLYLLVKLVSNARIPPPLAFSAVPNGFSPQQRLYRSMDPIVTTTTALAAWHKTPATTRSTGSADDDDDGASSARKIPHQQTDRHPLAQQQHADDCHEHVDPTTTTAKQSSRSSSSWTYIYELLEPLHLELGGVGKKVQHVVDYAYTPAVMDHDFGDGGESLASSSHSRHTTVHNEDEDETHGVETTDNGHGSETSSDSSSGKGELEEPESIPRGFFHWRWWQWWMPWTTVQNERKKSERHSFSQDGEYDSSSSSYSGYYKLDPEAFAGGSHGQVWRGQRRRRKRSQRNGSEGQAFECDSDTLENDYNFEEEMEKEPLIFKRLKVNSGFRTLEAGLREVYFGNLLSQLNTKRPSSVDDKQSNSSSLLFTEYVEHFFGDESEGGELWIVFRDAGPSLRSFLYSSLDAGDYVVYQHSGLWSRMRMSLHAQDQQEPINEQQIHLDAVKSDDPLPDNQVDEAFGSELIRTVLRQILEAADKLHQHGIVHRDVKPANIMCHSNLDVEQLQSSLAWTGNAVPPRIRCVLGDFSSAWDEYTDRNLYSRGPSRLEHTSEYAPPEAIFGQAYNDTGVGLSPSFDSWSIGIVALELLLGTPNVFSVDQRTRMILSHKMLKEGATKREIEKAMYLAALSHFCIYSPLTATQNDTPLSFNASHQSSIAKPSCTLNDFNRALRARDPLGWGFESSDTLLHLIWRLLAWDPKERMTTADALKHPFMVDPTATVDATAGDQTALESQMLDPRTDFNVSDSIDQFVCPKCGRTFRDWSSCHTHANARKHAKFCSYDKSSLPKCLNAHALLPNHASSGYCGIQGRRRTIEDFHAIHLLQSQQFYGIFDGHLGNFASKYSALFLYEELSSHLTEVMSNRLTNEADDEGNCNTSEWKRRVEVAAMESFEAVHDKFLSAAATRRTPHGLMDQSGTTATILLVSNTSYIVASIGDSRAVLSSRRKTRHNDDGDELVAVQLTTDHVASNKDERLLVESRGGRILRHNPDDGGRDRVNGSLITTRSIGDAGLSLFLSRQPDVLTFTRSEILKACGVNGREWKSTFDSESINLDTSNKKQTRANASTTTSTTGSMDGEAIIPATDSLPCFMILASDGLWDTVSNQEAVDLVHEVVSSASSSFKGTTTTASAQLLQRQQHYDASLSQELPYLPREPTSATSRGRGGGRDELGGGLQQAAEALTLEAYVRGSTDNIAVCIVAID